MKLFGLLVLFTACLISSCQTTPVKYRMKPKTNSWNLFTLEQDVELGKKFVEVLESDSSDLVILDSATNCDAYAYLYEMRDKILATGNVVHPTDFEWRIRIIEDDTTLNAFCLPGGYIYIYTGIIKYLDNESELAGILGHEIGHADLRHTTRRLSLNYTISSIYGSMVGSLFDQVIGVSFSRDHETEADRMSVEYLCGTEWPSDGAAGFFKKMELTPQSDVPQWLSTHPSPANRISNYHVWDSLSGCTGNEKYEQRFKEFQALF